MNLTLGCIDRTGKEVVYYLMDGQSMSKQEWTGLVKKHIKQNGNQTGYEKIHATVSLWNKHDSIEEVAMHVYASKYCTNLQVEKRERAVKPIKAEKETGYKQLTIC